MSKSGSTPPLTKTNNDRNQENIKAGEKPKSKSSKKTSKRQSLPQPEVDPIEIPQPKPSEKSHRKAAQPKVNCWSRRPDPHQQERQRTYYSQHVEDIVEPSIEPIVLNREGRHPLHQHLGELQISNIMPVEINFEEHFKTIEVGVSDAAE
mgnify:FL=1